MEQKTILVVDDEHNLVEMIKARLVAKSYNVIAAYNGEDGLSMAREHNPDLIILDIVMPKITGDVMASMLKGDEETQNIPIIFLTCLASGITDKQKAYMGKNDVFLAKPFDAKELLSVVDSLIKKTSSS